MASLPSLRNPWATIRNPRQSNGILNLEIENECAAGLLAVVYPPSGVKYMKGCFRLGKMDGQLYRNSKQAVFVGMLYANMKKPVLAESTPQMLHGLSQERKQFCVLRQKTNNITVIIDDGVVLLQSA